MQQRDEKRFSRHISTLVYQRVGRGDDKHAAKRYFPGYIVRNKIRSGVQQPDPCSAGMYELGNTLVIRIERHYIGPETA